MRPGYLFVLWLVLSGTVAACNQQTERAVTPAPEPAPAPAPPTAEELLSDFDGERDAGRLQKALEVADILVAQYPESEEAQQAAAEISALEESIKAAEEEERKRRAEAAASAEAERLAAKWSYGRSEDAMTSRETRQASIQSENTVVFDFPYQGPQRGTLVLRDHPSYGKDVIFRIEQGQILCHSFSSCDVRVRFDDGTPERWSAAESADNNSTVIFLRNYNRFIQRLRSASVVRVQVPMYQEGNPVFEFRVGGFDFDRYSGRS